MINTELLEAIKNELDITWKDEGEDMKISSFISQGMQFLNQVVGMRLDYTAADFPRSMLRDYVMYARSQALDEFQKNHLSNLLFLQDRAAMGYYRLEDEDSDENGDENGGEEVPANKVTRVRPAGANATARFAGDRFIFSGGEFKYLTDDGWKAITIRQYETDFIFDTDIVLNVQTKTLHTMTSYPTESHLHWVGDMSIINEKQRVYIEGMGAFEKANT